MAQGELTANDRCSLTPLSTAGFQSRKPVPARHERIALATCPNVHRTEESSVSFVVSLSNHERDGTLRSMNLTTSDNESVVDRFLAVAGVEEEGRYLLRAEVLARLVRLLTGLGEMRLGLLTGLQTALPRADEGSPIEELKETMTNLIIMQSRTAGRESGVADNILELAQSGEIGPVPVDREKLRNGLTALLQAAGRIGSAGEASG